MSSPACITAGQVASVRTIAEPCLSPDGRRLAWLHGYRGRGDVAVADVEPDVGPEVFVTTEPSIGASVGHGGGITVWAPDGESLLYRSAAGTLWKVGARGGTPAEVLGGCVASAPAWCGDVAVCAVSGPAFEEIVAFTPDDRGRPSSVSGRRDFCLDPDLAPVAGRDGACVAWHEWDATAMPWDASRIVFRAEGDSPVTIDGGAGVSVAEPRFSPDGSVLAYLCDRSGFRNVWVAEPGSGTTRLLTRFEAEIGGPTWGGGDRSFAWSPDGTEIAHTLSGEGRTELWVTQVADGASRPLVQRAGTFSWLSWRGRYVAATYADPFTARRVELVDPVSATCRVASPRGAGELGAWGDVSHVTWSDADGDPVHGILATPTHADTACPTIVWVHGGPTGQAQLDFAPRVAYFVSRGWAVLFVNHRGSTGYGRAYTQALHGRWGELDVRDVLSGVEEMARRGVADPARLAVMGASAGGYTVLQTLIAAPDVFAAGVDLYGVADLFHLAETTHRFEAAYNDSLVGPLPEAADLYVERSPITHADRIRTPLLVLQGGKDEVVLPEQSRKLVRAVERNGVDAEFHCYEDEGHGWGRAETVHDELARVEAFLRRHVLRRAR
ncbi:MAG: S9 family peptidase [Acidimicrobiia bacterium]|nr:S9 family peptidase [Acidimicrobiia bacterium]